ncbi:MAG: transcriptional activator NhaR [Candidatus Thiodiazotropha sp. (ex Epidulcina cf. delphinae)]|nr:transcriptional activator NhaR [Candidatus Thiodiazotropha sp. (ex Epidulcina cf. delphinae)]
MVNYKHLHYFWMVAREGSIAKASERLHLTPQTISGQLTLLEEQLGNALFTRVGRNLELTETGRLVLSYAEEIFSLGSELEETLRNLPEKRSLGFRVGVADVVPKSIAYRLLAPALNLPEPVRILCREENLDMLLGELAVHHLDLVIADRPMPPSVSVRAYNHLLGECGISFFAAAEQPEARGGGFPQALNGTPMLLPSENTAVRSGLVSWFDKRRIHPCIVAEFDDSALMKAFGQAGSGVFIAPMVIEAEVKRQYGVRCIGRTDDVVEHFYAISVERKISHPAVVAIMASAREELFCINKPVKQTS